MVEKARYQSSLEQVDQAKAALKQAMDDLSKTTIFAPMEGTISKLNKEVGDFYGLIKKAQNFYSDIVFEKRIVKTRKKISKYSLKEAIEETYGKKGREIVEMNWKAVDASLDNINEINYPSSWTSLEPEKKMETDEPDFITRGKDPPGASNTLHIGE